MSDTDRLIALLRERRVTGLHSHEARRQGLSGNPSQRSKDAVSRGIAISKRREHVGRRQGVRFWLAEYAPADALPVSPNFDVEVGSDLAEASTGPSVNPPVAADPGAGGDALFDQDDYREKHGWADQEEAA